MENGNRWSSVGVASDHNQRIAMKERLLVLCWAYGSLRSTPVIVKVDGAWKSQGRRRTWRAAIAWHFWWHLHVYANGETSACSRPTPNEIPCYMKRVD